MGARAVLLLWWMSFAAYDGGCSHEKIAARSHS